MNIQRAGPPAHLRLLPATGDQRAPLRTAPAGARIRVLIAAGPALVRASYRALLYRDQEIEVVGEAASAQEAFALAVDVRPDVAVLDLGVLSDEEFTRGAAIISHPAFADVPVLVVAASENDDCILGAVRAGAVGVLALDADPAGLIAAVRLLAGGDALLPARVVRRLRAELLPSRHFRRPSQELDELTDREREVVGLVAKGLSNDEIGSHLEISPATAKTHTSRAMVKLHARDRAQLVVFAYEAGLVVARTRTPPPSARLTAIV